MQYAYFVLKECWFGGTSSSEK